MHVDGVPATQLSMPSDRRPGSQQLRCLAVNVAQLTTNTHVTAAAAGPHQTHY